MNPTTKSPVGTRRASFWARNLTSVALLGAASFGGFACGNPGPSSDGQGSSGGPAVGGNGNPGTGASPNGGSGDPAGGGPAGGGGGGTGGQIDPPELPSECTETKRGSRLLRRLTAAELRNTETDVFGAQAAAATTTLPGEPVDKIRLSNDAATLTVTQDAAQAILDRAEEVAEIVTAASALPTNLPCSSATPDETCAGEFIKKYGSGLFRRELAQADVERYLALYRSIVATADFPSALKWVLVGLIQSPHAVYRSELGTGGKLTPYEVASELAYDYSASPPSPELIALALSGGLEDPEVRYAEAKKLLLTERGSQVIQTFFADWLSYRNVLTVSRSNGPDNFESVRRKMVQETEQFLEKLVVEKSGKLADLMTADYTVADAEVASYYGFSGGAGDFGAGTAAEVKRTFGLGVFGQGSVTTSMASIAITSPTRRGLLLLRRLFCEIPPLPEAVNFDLTANEVSGNTTRERLENSHLGGPCADCHANFDPLGFAFEHIDNIGRYREQETTPNGTFPIDATATVAKLNNLAVDGEEELMRGLSTSAEVLSCISGTMTRYIYGSDGECRDPSARSRVMSGETSIVDFLAELAKEPHFVERM
jgi:Protein of unknown function (DUF1592)/Protein of unknown function (DUF1588)/Protein of unknown function (DUF1595)/Protein of unknown function (DUF1587)